MAEATNPIPTASNPRVGATQAALAPEMIEAGAKAAYYLNRGVPNDAWERDLPDSTRDHWRSYAEAVLMAAFASAPSPEAGAGGDLAQQVRQIVREAMAKHWDDEGAPHTAALMRAGKWDDVDPVRPAIEGGMAVARELNARSGKLVASTGSGEKTKGAPASPTGLLPDGPTASRSSGFAAAIPSRDALHQLCWSEMPKYGLMSFEQLSEAVSEVMVADRHYKRALPLTECFIGHEVVSINFNSLNRIVTTFVQAALALGTEAEDQDAEGSLVHEGPAPQGATP